MFAMTLLRPVRRHLLASMALGLLCPSSPAAAQLEAGGNISFAPIALQDDPSGADRLGRLRFRGAIELRRTDADGGEGQNFRGYSGLWVSKDGRRVAGVNFGEWMTASLTYDRDGHLAGLSDIATGPLLDEAGRIFEAEDDKDAEALDFDGKRFLVGFERHDRILGYRDFKSPAQTIALPSPALANIPYNMGFSSVAPSRMAA